MKNIGQEKLHCKEISVFQIPDMIRENIQIKQAIQVFDFVFRKLVLFHMTMNSSL